VDLLEFLVISRQPDLLFLFLVGEYRAQPTVKRAIVLFDVFCAEMSPCQVRAKDAVPPRDQRLHIAVEKLRSGLEDRENTGAATILVPKYLFDDLAVKVEEAAAVEIGILERDYDPAREPRENLPGERMTAGQRWFVERVWEPRVRPQLVTAGFRRIANIG
jgi:hypothetical protein